MVQANLKRKLFLWYVKIIHVRSQRPSMAVSIQCVIYSCFCARRTKLISHETVCLIHSDHLEGFAKPGLDFSFHLNHSCLDWSWFSLPESLQGRALAWMGTCSASYGRWVCLGLSTPLQSMLLVPTGPVSNHSSCVPANNSASCPSQAQESLSTASLLLFLGTHWWHMALCRHGSQGFVFTHSCVEAPENILRPDFAIQLISFYVGIQKNVNTINF